MMRALRKRHVWPRRRRRLVMQRSTTSRQLPFGVLKAHPIAWPSGLVLGALLGTITAFGLP